MRADPDDRFSLDMLGSVTPIESARPYHAPYKALKPAIAQAAVQSANQRPLDDVFALETPLERDVVSILVEASSEQLRAPTYDELWTRPRHAHAPTPRAAAPAPGRSRRAPGLAGIVSIVIGAMAVIGLREKIVAIAPPAARGFALIGLPVNLPGLELREVRSHIEMEGARKVLAIEGEITNLRREANSVPAVSLTVRGEDGQAKYAWTTRAPKSRLEPRETVAFRARLASPPEAAADVLVRFASAEETARQKAGTK